MSAIATDDQDEPTLCPICFDTMEPEEDSEDEEQPRLVCPTCAWQMEVEE